MALPPSSPSQSLITDRSGAAENLYDPQLPRHFNFGVFGQLPTRDGGARFCALLRRHALQALEVDGLRFARFAVFMLWVGVV